MSSTWEIEYRGQLADGASGGDKRSLAAWGLASFDLSVLNLDRGNLSLVVSGETPFVADLPWAYRDKIILWRNGSRYWHGWLTREPRAAQPEADSISLIFGDPYWWLDQTTMTDPTIKNVIVGNVSWGDLDLGATITGIRNVSLTWAEPSGDIVWANWRDQARYTVQGQIRRAYYAAARVGAPIALGTIGIDAAAPAQESAGNTALDYLRGAVAYEPLAVGWWDYSGATPVLNVQPRSALSTISYDLAGAPLGVQCEPLRELKANAVTIRWRYTDEDGDDATYSEHAGPAELTGGPNVLVLDASVSDYEQRVEAVSYGIAAHLLAALGPLAYAGSLSLVDDISALAASRPGLAINLAGGRTEWATMAGVIQQVALSVVDEAESLTVTWGAPRHLGIGEWLDISRHAGDGLGGAVDPDRLPDGPTGTDPQPGTYDDLNQTPAASPAGNIAIQTRGGTWIKCGYPSYNGTQPTRRWLRADTTHIQFHLCPGDTVPNSTGFSGAGVWTPAWPCPVGPVVTGSSPRGWEETTVFCRPSAPMSRSATLSTATASPGTYISIGQCCGSDYPINLISGSEENRLSQEDGEESAAARRIAAASWEDGTEAIRTIPETVATGIRRLLRYGTYNASGVYTPLTGMAPWATYRLHAVLERRPVDEAGTATGTGAWSPAGDSYSAPWFADLDGHGGATWVEIEPTPGYATRIASITPEVC